MKPIYLFHFLFFVCIFCFCKKKFDNPPYLPVNDGAQLSIQQLRERSNGANSIYRFGGGDTNLYCTVSMDESSGNIYKQVFVRDDAGTAMQVRLVNSGGLFVGDRIRINLNNAWLVCANSMLYLDSLDLEKSVVKLSSGSNITPLVTSIPKILSYSSSPQSAGSLQSQLIELNSVEFAYAARGKSFANAIGKTALEYVLTDCSNKQITVRTSGMANFASKLTPLGNGKLIAVVQQYNSELSLIIRNYNELQMNATPCITAPTFTGSSYASKDFNDNSISSGGWTTAVVTGTSNWTSSNLGQSNYYARIYNKTSSVYDACESWLISPELDLSLAVNPILTFSSANSSSVSPFSVMVSTNYSSGSPTLATWTELQFTRPAGNFTFTNSGDLSLIDYKSSKLRIAFKYGGTNTTGSIWEVDNIVVREK
ncbi:MAG: DUF5689 domain-containing protein [bacterium]|nr:DUF5689 domain-containing protein [bacterium]